jgi:hypothetical protein
VDRYLARLLDESSAVALEVPRRAAGSNATSRRSVLAGPPASSRLTLSFPFVLSSSRRREQGAVGPRAYRADWQIESLGHALVREFFLPEEQERLSPSGGGSIASATCESGTHARRVEHLRLLERGPERGSGQSLRDGGARSAAQEA